jgi:hypothetical protein
MTSSKSETKNCTNKTILRFYYAFDKLFKNIPDLQERGFANKNNPQQCRYYFPQWEIMDNRPNYSIFYEINDWNRYEKAEIRIDIQFWLEGFHEIGEQIRLQKDSIAQQMPLQPTTIEWYIDKKNPKWGRLQYCFPDSSNPEIIARCMNVLIYETKDDVNSWLISKKMKHY